MKVQRTKEDKGKALQAVFHQGSLALRAFGENYGNQEPLQLRQYRLVEAGLLCFRAAYALMSVMPDHRAGAKQYVVTAGTALAKTLREMLANEKAVHEFKAREGEHRG